MLSHTYTIILYNFGTVYARGHEKATGKLVFHSLSHTSSWLEVAKSRDTCGMLEIEHKINTVKLITNICRHRKHERMSRHVYVER